MRLESDPTVCDQESEASAVPAGAVADDLLSSVIAPLAVPANIIPIAASSASDHR
jgi:hypothetical protein